MVTVGLVGVTVPLDGTDAPGPGFGDTLGLTSSADVLAMKSHEPSMSPFSGIISPQNSPPPPP
jgi:hypothetical protein